MVPQSSSTKLQTSNISNNNGKLYLPVPKHRNITEYVRESQLLLWLWRMISEISCFDYEQYLRDGVVLCQLIKTLAPEAFADTDSGKPLIKGEDKREKKANIERFLDCCRAYGLDEKQLFEVEDLLSMQDIPRVTRCLFTLGKQAAEKFGKPELGKAYDLWLEEELSGHNAEQDPIRRSGMPIGDDLYVSHVSTNWLKDKLARRRAADARSIRKPPPDPLVQRTSSKPLSELKAMFVGENGQQTTVPNGGGSDLYNQPKRRQSSPLPTNLINKFNNNH